MNTKLIFARKGNDLFELAAARPDAYAPPSSWKMSRRRTKRRRGGDGGGGTIGPRQHDVERIQHELCEAALADGLGGAVVEEGGPALHQDERGREADRRWGRRRRQGGRRGVPRRHLHRDNVRQDSETGVPKKRRCKCRPRRVHSGTQHKPVNTNFSTDCHHQLGVLVSFFLFETTLSLASLIRTSFASPLKS